MGRGEPGPSWRRRRLPRRGYSLRAPFRCAGKPQRPQGAARALAPPRAPLLRSSADVSPAQHHSRVRCPDRPPASERVPVRLRRGRVVVTVLSGRNAPLHVRSAPWAIRVADGGRPSGCRMERAMAAAGEWTAAATTTRRAATRMRSPTTARGAAVRRARTSAPSSGTPGAGTARTGCASRSAAPPRARSRRPRATASRASSSSAAAGCCSATTRSPRTATLPADSSPTRGPGTAARWTEITGPQPPARVEAAAAWDPKRKRLVLFGGYTWTAGVRERLQDTWEFNGAAWARFSTTGPAPRSGAAMAFDAELGQVVLFGGSGARATRGSGTAPAGRKCRRRPRRRAASTRRWPVPPPATCCGSAGGTASSAPPTPGACAAGCGAPSRPRTRRPRATTRR